MIEQRWIHHVSVNFVTSGIQRILSLRWFLKTPGLSLNIPAVTAFKNYKDKPTDAPLMQKFEQAKLALDSHREAHVDKIVNVGFLHYLENWWRDWKPSVVTK